MINQTLGHNWTTSGSHQYQPAWLALIIRNTWVLPALAFLACHGMVWLRGGYADDFYFIAHVSERTYLDAVIDSPVFSRWGQAIILPAIYGLVSGVHGDQSYWWIAHAIGVCAFVAALFFIDKAARELRFTYGARLIALTLFALHPLKLQAILWPATIVGYTIPLAALALAAFLSIRMTQREHDLLSSILLACLLLYVSLSLEQYFIVVLAGLFVWMLLNIWQRRPPWLPMSLGLIVVAGFVSATFLAGSTNERLAGHPITVHGLVEHLTTVVPRVFQEEIVHSARYLIDPYWWNTLHSLVLSPQFVIVLVILGAVSLALFMSWSRGKDPIAATPMRWIVALSLLFASLWLASWIPFILLDYYIPLRVHLLPLLFFLLIVGLWADWIARQWLSNRVNNVLVIIFFLSTSVMATAALVCETDFRDNWQRTQRIAEHVQSIEPGDNRFITLIGLPRQLGPAPGFANGFSFPWMLQRIRGSETPTGSTTAELINLFPGLRQPTTDVALAAETRIWLWSEALGDLLELDAIEVEKQLNCTPAQSERGAAFARLPVELELNDSRGHKLWLEAILHHETANLAILVIRIDRAAGEMLPSTLTVHAVNQKTITVPYDASLDAKQWDETQMWKSVVVHRFDSLNKLLIGLDGRESEAIEQRLEIKACDTESSHVLRVDGVSG